MRKTIADIWWFLNHYKIWIDIKTNGIKRSWKIASVSRHKLARLMLKTQNP